MLRSKGESLLGDSKGSSQELSNPWCPARTLPSLLAVSKACFGAKGAACRHHVRLGHRMAAQNHPGDSPCAPPLLCERPAVHHKCSSHKHVLPQGNKMTEPISLPTPKAKLYPEITFLFLHQGTYQGHSTSQGKP